MIYTDNDSLEMTQEIIVNRKDFGPIQSRYFIHSIPNTPLNFCSANFEKDLFVVDWQLSMEGNSKVNKLRY